MEGDTLKAWLSRLVKAVRHPTNMVVAKNEVNRYKIKFLH